MDKVETLLEKEYWVIDFLPRQVKKDEAGQFFAIEQYFLKEEQAKLLQEKFLRILLKLNCYYDISVCVNDEWVENPAPDALTSMTQSIGCLALIQDSLLMYGKDDLCMTVYQPDEEILDLLKQLANGEGLYVWKPQQ